jgi:tetratricopeptide (TPR) repeat protein
LKKGEVLTSKAIARIVLALVLAAGTFGTTNGILAQDKGAEKPADNSQDKRADAVKKYLEAKRLEETGNYSGAVEAYKQAIDLDPKSSELRVALGSLYLKNRNTIDAETQVSEAAKLAPQDQEVRKLLARIYITQSLVGTTIVKEKAHAAIRELEEIVKQSAQTKLEIGDQEQPALMLIGQLYLALEEPDKALDAFKRNSEGNSASDEAQFQLALVYFQKNKFREAASTVRRAYDLNAKTPNPQKTLAYSSLLGRSLLRIGRSQEAVEVYKKALGLDKKPLDKPIEKGDDLFAQQLILSPLLPEYVDALVFAGRYDEASRNLDPLLKLVRKDSPAYLNLVRMQSDIKRRSGQREEATQLLEGALKGQDVSESLYLVYALAETYEEMQNFDKAISTYEEALATVINPDGTVNDREDEKQKAMIILQRIGLAYRLAGKRDKTMETFERMKKLLGPKSSRADQLIVDTLMSEGKYKEAFELSTQSVDRFPDERAFKFYKAQSAGKLGDFGTTDTTLKAMLKNSPEDAEIYMFWSSVQLDGNLVKEAEDSVRKAIAIDPGDLAPLVTLASVQDRQKKYKESEATLRRALEIDPDNATVLNNLGYFLADRNEKLAEAEALIRRAVNIEPTNGSFLDSLGWLLYRQNKLEEARKYLEQAVIYQARSATIHDHLGDLYKKLGQTEKARAKWEDALKLATEPDELKKIKEKLGKK